MKKQSLQFRGRSSAAFARRASSRVTTETAKKSDNKEEILIQRYGTKQLFGMSLRFIRLSVISFWRRHRVASRLSLIAAVLLLLFTVGYEIYEARRVVVSYNLDGKYSFLLDEPRALYASEIKSDSKGGFTFNSDFTLASETIGDSAGPKITAAFGAAPQGTVSVTDPVNEVSMALTPRFRVGVPQQDENRIVYPVSGKNAKKVYTLKASGVKEDIILSEKGPDSMSFSYDVQLAEGLELRAEPDGSLGVYGVDPALLGSVSASSEEDQALLQKARTNGQKTNLIFRVPAPVIIEAGKKKSEAKAWFTVKDKLVELSASDLHKASYPLSIDPTIYVETARKLMRGNNETNIDFDVSNELIQKSQTTGARIDSWSSTTNLSSAVYGQGTAVAGGYIYSVGGVGSGSPSSTPYGSAGSSSYIVPTGVNYLTVKVWGAGGSGGNGSGSTGIGGAGGGGGYAKAVIAVTPGETLTIDVGSAGADRGTSSSAGGNGGGFSAIRRGGTYLVQAGGGGGGGGSRGNSNGDGGAGGAGGGSPAANGVNGESGNGGRFGYGGHDTLTGTPSDGGATGTGGTAGASGVANGGGNGAGSDAATCNDAMEAADTGGNGGTGAGGAGGNDTSSCSNGGGGGGGRFGGGGGGSTTSNNAGGGGGGGGSSYINPTGLVAGTDVQTTGSGQTPGNSGDGDRSGAGEGGAGGTSTSGGVGGTDGRVVLSYTSVGSVSNKVYWAQFNSSTNAIESPNPGTGACSGWCNDTDYDLPAALTGLSLVAYNGFLYAIGGSNSGGTPQTTVYIAKLGANGEPQLWHPTGGTPTYWYTDTALSNARSQFAAVANNNRLYILGGLTTSTTVLSSNTVQVADIKPNGTLTTWTTTGMQALSGTGGGNRYGLTAHIYNDYIYVIGGNATFSGTPVTNVDFAKLNSDGTMNSWVSTRALQSSGRLTVGGSFSTVFGGYMYVNGGCTSVNSSGYCTAIATDVQLSSINADGSLAGWNTILGLTNDRFAHTMIAWQGGLYRLGGCREQDPGTGGCGNTVLDVDYGVINPDGEASTVATSVTSGNNPCTGTSPYNCSVPSSSVGNMLNATAIVNGYLYIMGGCTNNACTTYSSGVVYQAVGSDGSLQRPNSCAGTYTDSYCISSSSLPVALGAPGVTVFDSRIYIVGGFPTVDNIYYVTVNYDGSLGLWQNNNTNTGTTTTADTVSYTFAYARANPSSASTNPGNLYIIGGCSTDGGGSIAGIGCSGYSQDVWKCNITTSGTVTSCSTTGQLQIGTVTGASGTGLGAFAGAVYANYIYLMGGLAPGITDLTTVRYARFNDSNNIVTVSSGWVEGSNVMNTGRRRGAGFGYNGYLYVLGGYDGADAIADIEFAKINVSDGSWEAFDQSSVTIQKRWALTTVVSNSYAYVIGGCTDGAAPSSCNTRTDTIQTFQIYNNDSGTPVSYSAGANLFATDRIGAGTVIYNGYIYVAGGCTSTADECASGSGLTDNVQFAALDAYGNIGTWSNTADPTMSGVRGFGKLLEAGGTLYWIGGINNTTGGSTQTIHYGTPDTTTGNISAWTDATSNLPNSRAYFGAAVWNDRIYVVGGATGASAPLSARANVYISPQMTSGGDMTGSWTTSGNSINISRYGLSLVAYANNLYALGGFDGTNYLNDVQFTQINSDGSIDAWAYSTSLPGKIAFGDAYAANGYIYQVGGRSSATNCTPKTLVAPISANTTIATGNNPTGVGEWFETNVKYTGNRAFSSVAYDKGKLYVIGGSCNGFPSIQGSSTQEFTTATTSHNVTMPTTVDSGDLLMVLFTNDGNATVTTPAGWTAPTNGTQVRGTAARGSVFIKVAAGTEDGTNVDFVTSATEEASAIVYKVAAGSWSGSTAGVEVANGGDPGATTTTPDPPALDPGAWGTENTLWFAYAAGSSYTAVTSYPTNYNGGTHDLSNTGTGGASVSAAWRENAVSSENPGTFTMSTNSDGVAFTIAVRPAGYSLTGANRIVQTAVYSQPQVAVYSRMIDTDTDVFPTSWLMNGIDNSIGARWQVRYRSMHDISDGAGQQNPFEDCGTSSTMATMTTWGHDFSYGDVTLGDVASYVARNGTTTSTGTITQSGNTVTGSGTSWGSDLTGGILYYADGTRATITAVNSATSLTVSASKTIGSAQSYTVAGGNINCARYYYFYISIDASQTFGYPEDVNRGPTINDLSLFFTADPSKRLRHGKTFTGGEQQPLDTPCRQTNDAECPLP